MLLLVEGLVLGRVRLSMLFLKWVLVFFRLIFWGRVKWWLLLL